jgi:nitric oxide reductase subunit B
MIKLRWLRFVGDTVFTFGIFGICWFILGLKTGWSLEGKQVDVIDAEILAPDPVN